MILFANISKKFKYHMGIESILYLRKVTGTVPNETACKIGRIRNKICVVLRKKLVYA